MFNLIDKKKFTADKVVFFVCLLVTLGLFVGGFLVPPTGVIDGSVLTAGSILMGFATLAVAAQTIKDGRMVKFSKGETELQITDEN